MWFVLLWIEHVFNFLCVSIPKDGDCEAMTPQYIKLLAPYSCIVMVALYYLY